MKGDRGFEHVYEVITTWGKLYYECWSPATALYMAQQDGFIVLKVQCVDKYSDECDEFIVKIGRK